MKEDNAIAIIGMSCRLPDANNVDEFWKNLIDGKDSVRSIPKERWYMTGGDDLVAGYLKCHLDEFDANFFNISPKEAPFIDPQQRLFLEVGWESIENARISPSSLANTKTGVWLGIDSDEYFRSQLDVKEDTLYKVMGNTFSAATGRLSYFLNLTGPSVAVSATCASSAVAIHLACTSLLNGGCTLALAGGVNTLLETSTSYPSALLSTRCKAFDVTANGFAPAEGCGVLVLKRLDQAIENRDNILATICGSAINHTGKSSSFGTPNSETQEEVVRNALKVAGVSPSQVTYFETHGTGTSVGDPTEITGIKNVYSEHKRDQPLILGSVKTNIGHALSAAGVTGIIKTILCMKHRQIPKHLHLSTLNPAIPALDSIPAIIPMDTMTWEPNSNGDLYGAVSCFGITGNNVHFILKEGSSSSPKGEDTSEESKIPTHLVTISANDEVALENLCQEYKAFINQGLPFTIADFAYSLNTTRTQQPFRIATTASSLSEMISKISSQDYVKGIVRAQSSREPVTFLFTGHGCQYFGMAKAFYDTNAAFKSAFDECSTIFRNNFDVSLQDFIWENEASDMTKTKLSQPAIYCIQYCLLKLWESVGVTPDVVLGHSIGEFAACVAAGIISFDDGMRLVVGRSQLADKLTSTSRMMAVGSTEVHVKDLVAQFTAAYPQYWVDIATINSTHQTVISTSLEAMEFFSKFLTSKAPSVKTKVLASEHGFHSRAMDPILDEFETIASQVKVNAPRCKYVSGTLARILTKSDITATYWRNHLRNTVSFSDAADLVLGEGNRIFVEIGPQPVLLNFILANYTGESSIVTCPSIRSGQECYSTFLGSLAKLHVSGGVEKINFDDIYKGRKITLPNYVFNRKKYWATTANGFAGIQLDENTKVTHPLLGCKLNLPQSKNETRFYNCQSVSTTKYIRDHVIADNVIVPAAAYLEMTLAVGKELGDHQVLVVEDLTVSKALYLDNKSIQVHTLVTENGADLNVGIFSDRNGGDWIQHASSVVRFSSKVVPPVNFNLADARSSCLEECSVKEMYMKLSVRGFTMGDQFQSLHKLWHNEDNTKILTEVKNMDFEDSVGYICHPVLLDAMVQTFWQYKMIDTPESAFALPVSIGRFTWYGNVKLTNLLYVHVVDESSLGLYTDEGVMVAKMDNVALVDSTQSAFLKSISLAQQLPQFMTRDLVKYTTPTVSRIDLAKLPNLASSTMASNLELAREFRINTDEMERRCSRWCYLFILKALMDIGWIPSLREIYSTENWTRLVNGNAQFDLKVFERFNSILAEEGVLSPDGFVINLPPSLKEIQKELAEFKAADLEVSTVEYKFIKSLGEALPGVLKGTVDPVHTLFNKLGANVATMYSDSKRCKFDHSILSNSFESLLKGSEATLNKGMLRILEIGAGTGGATSHLLPILKSLGIQFQYTFTDIGPSFLPDAKKNFSEYSNHMQFDILDIEKDPKIQGFVPNSYDIVIASQVVHAAGNLSTALGNVRHLLVESGFFFLVELTEAYRDFAISYDLLKSFWKLNDFRVYPIVNSETWLDLLKKNGFVSAIDTVPLEGIKRTVILARATDGPHQYKQSSTDTWIIFSSDTDILHAGLTEKLQLAGKRVFCVRQGLKFEKVNDLFSVNSKRFSDFKQLSHVLKNYAVEGVIFEWGLTDSQQNIRTCEELKKCTENTVAGFLNVIKLLTSKTWVARLCLVTAGVEELNPNCAGLWGLLYAYLNEFPENLATGIDIDLSCPSTLAAQVFSMLWGPMVERETTFKQGYSYTARLHNLDSDLPSSQIRLPNSGNFKLGNATDLDFRFTEISSQPTEASVEVSVQAVGLNFRDLLLGSSLLDEQDPGSVGLEFAGTISQVGKAGKFQVGDRVVGLSDKGSVMSQISVPDSDLLFKIPNDMTFVEAATLPVAYGTCYLSLVDIAKVQPGERVLIHTGSGGVGLSGIQLARLLGAEIFVTAGTNKKRNYLRQVLGLTNVYDSRNTAYSDQILADTNGSGVDVVINTLTGVGFKEATLKCLTKNARFIELSKLNVWSVEEVSRLRSDVQYTILDAFQMISTSSPRMVSALAELGKLFSSGQLKALPQTTFPLAQIRSAFQFFQKSQHIGKIVIEFPETLDNPVTALFKPESCYLVTGGLGGLGLQVVKFIAESGGNVVVVGRKSPSEDSLKQLAPLGERVTIVQADVGDYAKCISLLQSFRRPLKGIFHCAGVFSNAFIMNQSIESFSKVFHPKIYGTWNLHELTKTLDLDYFVMFSSVASILGSAGLSNYAGANRYMDSLIAYRTKHLGLKGMTINWGPWDEVGAAAGYNAGMFKNFSHISPEAGILSLERALRLGVSQTVIADIDPNLSVAAPRVRNLLSELNFNYRHRNKTLSAVNTAGTLISDPAVDGRLGTMLKSVFEAKEAGQRLSAMEAVVETCFRIHASIDESDPVDRDQPLTLMGMDSLIGMEVRTRLAKLFKLSIPSNAIHEHNSVKLLSKYMLDALALDVTNQEDIAAGSSVEPIKEIENKSNPKSKPISNFFAKNLRKLQLVDKGTKKLGVESKKLMK